LNHFAKTATYETGFGGVAEIVAARWREDSSDERAQAPLSGSVLITVGGRTRGFDMHDDVLNPGIVREQPIFYVVADLMTFDDGNRRRDSDMNFDE
jgi:hypothetical protein